MSEFMHRARGYTLIELMLTIFVLSILTVIAVPNFRDFMRRNNVVSQSNSLLADLQYARSEAITRRGMVAVCPRAATAGEATATCASGGSATFDGGWLVYVTPTANTAYSASATGFELLRVTSVPGTVSMRAAATTMITFNPRGERTPTGNAGISICAKSDKGSADAGTSTTSVVGKRLTLESSGRASIASMAAGASCAS